MVDGVQYIYSSVHYSPKYHKKVQKNSPIQNSSKNIPKNIPKTVPLIEVIIVLDTDNKFFVKTFQKVPKKVFLTCFFKTLLRRRKLGKMWS